MKYRKWLSLILAVCLLFAVAGCGEEPGPSTGADGTSLPNVDVPGTTQGTKEPSGIEDTDPAVPATTRPYEEIIPTAPQTPEDPDAVRTAADPERGIYIFCGNNDYTLYADAGGFSDIAFYIYSLEPLGTDQIDAAISAEASYTVSVREIQLEGTVQVETGDAYWSLDMINGTQFSYELYCAYMGLDYSKLAQLWDAYEQSFAAYQAQAGTEEAAALYAQTVANKEAFTAYRDNWMVDYLRLSKEDLPQFYVYRVRMQFPYSPSFQRDEDIREVDVTIGDETYRLPIGEVRLRVEQPLPCQRDWYVWGGEAVDDGVMGGDTGVLPYHDGYNLLDGGLFYFTAQEAFTLTKLTVESPGVQIVEVPVTVYAAGGGKFEYTWDGNSPLTVLPGDRVMVEVRYHEESMSALEYNRILYVFLEYEYSGGTLCKYAQYYLNPYINHYEAFAMFVQGLSLEDYYRDYYYPEMEPWREERN